MAKLAAIRGMPDKSPSHPDRGRAGASILRNGGTTKKSRQRPSRLTAGFRCLGGEADAG